MPKKGHTCCVLGCTVNSKKTQLADGRRPRFFCFPHETKRPHLRRAWLALTRRTEASTNTRVCEFHFVDSKPSSVNPHPILNMGMEATKMQKRAQELRQQKELRKLIMQQQMAGLMQGQQQVLDGYIMLPGQQMIDQQRAGEMMGHDGIQGMNPGLDGAQQMGNFYTTINTDPGDTDHDLQQSLPTQIGCDGSGDNPVSLVAHKRLTAEEDQEDCAASMVSNGDYVESEVVQFGMDYDAAEDASFVSNSDSNQSYNPNAADELPEDIPLNPTAENLYHTPPLSCNDFTSPSSGSSASNGDTKDIKNATEVTMVTSDTKDDQGLNLMIRKENGQIGDGIVDDVPPQEAESGGNFPVIANSFSLTKDAGRPMANHNGTPEKVNHKSSLPLISQNGVTPVTHSDMPITSTLLTIPAWQLAPINGTVSAPPKAKKPRKRKSTTPHMKLANGSLQSPKQSINNNFHGTFSASSNTPTATQQQKCSPSNDIVATSLRVVEGLKSDILENLRAEFLTELRNESQSTRQLKTEMETVRLQTRQELQQMRVELHALWGENQRLRAQVEGLLPDKDGQNVDANS